MERDHSFNYRLLDRLISDCEYYLGFGNRCDKHLWAGNPRDQIAKMREIYAKLPEEPIWCPACMIDVYEELILP